MTISLVRTRVQGKYALISAFVSLGISPQLQQYHDLHDERHDGPRRETDKARLLYDVSYELQRPKYK